MALTKKQIYDLNNMNAAAQNASLGDLLDGGEGGALTPATETKLGGVKMASAISDATGENVTKDEFNALLTALRNAGILASNA